MPSNAGYGLLIHEVFKSHDDAPQSAELLWTSDQLVAETSTRQHITLTTDRHPWPRRDFDGVKRDKLFEILQNKNSPNLLLKSIIEIYPGNKIKEKKNNRFSEEHTINHGGRLGCPLSLTVFNIYMREIIVKYNQIYTKGIASSTSTKINIPFFADDQVIIADSEDNLQGGVFTL